MNLLKEILERRHEEPIKLLFLPKMSLLGSQASTEKKLVVNHEQLLKAVFYVFMGKNWEKRLKFKAEGREFAKFLRSHEQYI